MPQKHFITLIKLKFKKTCLKELALRKKLAVN